MTVPDDIYKIRLFGGPLDHPQEMKDAAELWRVIGLAACAWARLEQHIDIVLIHLNQPKHSAKLCDPDHPIGFKRKIKLLKRWFNQHPALADHRMAIRKLSPDLLALSKMRNTFLHSILDDFEPPTKKAVFRSVRPKGPDTVTAYKHVGTIETILTFIGETQEAYLKFCRVSVRVCSDDSALRLRTPLPHTRRPSRRSPRADAD